MHSQKLHFNSSEVKQSSGHSQILHFNSGEKKQHIDGSLRFHLSNSDRVKQRSECPQRFNLNSS